MAPRQNSGAGKRGGGAGRRAAEAKVPGVPGPARTAGQPRASTGTGEPGRRAGSGGRGGVGRPLGDDRGELGDRHRFPEGEGCKERSEDAEGAEERESARGRPEEPAAAALLLERVDRMAEASPEIGVRRSLGKRLEEADPPGDDPVVALRQHTHPVMWARSASPSLRGERSVAEIRVAVEKFRALHRRGRRWRRDSSTCGRIRPDPVNHTWPRAPGFPPDTGRPPPDAPAGGRWERGRLGVRLPSGLPALSRSSAPRSARSCFGRGSAGSSRCRGSYR